MHADELSLSDWQVSYVFLSVTFIGWRERVDSSKCDILSAAVVHSSENCRKLSTATVCTDGVASMEQMKQLLVPNCLTPIHANDSGQAALALHPTRILPPRPRILLPFEKNSGYANGLRCQLDSWVLFSVCLAYSMDSLPLTLPSGSLVQYTVRC